MENQRREEIKTHVEGRLLQRIMDLESVKLELEAETRASSGDEQAKNQLLLDATRDLLNKLKQAQLNIRELLEKNS